MTTTDTEIAAVHRAQLRDMPLEAIVSFLMEDKGFSVVLRKPGYTVWTEDALPLGYPPRAEEDEDLLPFEERR